MQENRKQYCRRHSWNLFKTCIRTVFYTIMLIFHKLLICTCLRWYVRRNLPFFDLGIKIVIQQRTALTGYNKTFTWGTRSACWNYLFSLELFVASYHLNSWANVWIIVYVLYRTQLWGVTNREYWASVYNSKKATFYVWEKYFDR